MPRAFSYLPFDLLLIKLVKLVMRYWWKVHREKKYEKMPAEYRILDQPLYHCAARLWYGLMTRVFPAQKILSVFPTKA